MPRNESWPGGVGLETMNGMDSSGSCDSVVSANSGFSDDSLEHLSAEEKACLMFLEETIESLDTEGDSGLSNDEPDQLPSPGNLTAKLTDLSVSMSKSKFNMEFISEEKSSNSEKSALKQPTEKNDTKYKQSYLVPTPFVVASRSLYSVPGAKPVCPTVKPGCSSKSQFTSKVNKPAQKDNQKLTAPPLPLEVNVVTPPSTKPRDTSVKTTEGSLPRGPLSYDALVHLRRNASTKKTPLCPTIDHTIDRDKDQHPIKEGTNFGNRSKSDKCYSEVHKSKSGPPVVAPKPKIPANIMQDISHSVKHATNPEVVRLEALQKLGLSMGQFRAAATQPPPKSHSSLDPVFNGITTGLSNSNTTRSPSFCTSQAPTEPKNRNLQSTVSFHHDCRNDKESHHPSPSSGLKTAGPQRFVSQDHKKNSTNSSEAPNKSVKTTSTAQPSSDKPSNVVGYTVMVVPGMGLDRKEALRKLGLLKD